MNVITESQHFEPYIRGKSSTNWVEFGRKNEEDIKWIDSIELVNEHLIRITDENEELFLFPV